MLDHHLIECLVIALGDQLLRGFVIEAAGLLDEPQEGAAAVVEMREPVLVLGGAEGMHIEADVFARACRSRCVRARGPG